MIKFEGNIDPVNYAMEWRVCPQFPWFEVSEYGDVRVCVATKFRPVGKRVPGSIGSSGYVTYHLPDAEGRFKNTHAYRLVAEAFLGPPPSPDHEVAHRSGSKLSAYWRDLRWSTRLDNHADRMTHGTEPKGRKNGNATLTEEQALEVRRAFREIKKKPKRSSRGELIALADKYGITEKNVYMIGDGYTWRHLPDEAE
jgi:hypothetical protein